MADLNLPVQPFMIVVGTKWEELTDFYISLDDVIYKRDTVLDCFDLLFKCFYVYDLQYPAESNMVWSIVENGLYNKGSPPTNSAVSTVLEELAQYYQDQVALV